MLDKERFETRLREVLTAATEDRRNQIACIINSWGWPRELADIVTVGRDRHDACRHAHSVLKELAPNSLAYHRECLSREVDSATGLSKGSEVRHDRGAVDRPFQLPSHGGHTYEDVTDTKLAFGCSNYCGAVVGGVTAWAPADVDPFGECPGPAMY